MRVSHNKHDVIANETLGDRKVVYITTNGKANLAQAISGKEAAFGITMNAANSGETVRIASADILKGFSGLSKGNIYYLSQDTAGGITNARPTSGIIVRVGVAIDVDKLVIQIYEEGVSIGEAFTDYGSSDGESSTTGTGYTEKLKLTVTPPEAGDYIVEWSAEVAISVDSGQLKVKLEQDNTTILDEVLPALEKANAYYSESGIVKVTLTTAPTDFDIDFARVDPSSTAYIRRARISIRRVI